MQKSEIKANKKAERKQQQKRKQKRMKVIMWATGICFIALIAIAFMLKPSSTLAFNYEELPLKGKADAPVKIVEFGDYKCPSCQIFSQKIFPQLQKDFIDAGTVGFYFADFTIIGPDSETAALAAQSVFHQNKDEFWKYYDALFKNQGQENVQWATADFLTELAQKNNIQVDYGKLRNDIDKKTYESAVERNNSLARRGNTMQTPTLFINGEMFTDVFNYDALKDAINKAAEAAAK